MSFLQLIVRKIIASFIESGIVFCALGGFSHFIPQTILGCKYIFSPYLMDKKVKAQRKKQTPKLTHSY